MMAKLKRTYQSHFLIRSASPSAHARATAEPAFSCPGILSQPPFSMPSALCQLLTSPSSLSFFSWFGCFINWATQVAADPPAMAAYVERRQREGAANGTINRELGVLSKVLRLAYENGKLVRVPV